MFSIIEKLRTWGIKGAITYLKSLGMQNQLVDQIEKNAQEYPLTPAPGVTVVGPIYDQTSLSKVLRDLIIKLNEAHIPFQTCNTSLESSVVKDEIRGLLTPPDSFMATKYNTVIGYFPPSLLKKHTAIQKLQLVFWEFESGLFEYDNRLAKNRMLCGMSDFVVDAIQKQSPKQIVAQKLLYPFLVPQFELVSRKDIRKRYGIADNDFAVFYNFSLNSSYYRKNPEGALHAFAVAFSRTENAKLILKINGAKSHPDKMLMLKELAVKFGIEDKIVTITDYLPTATIYSITAACDCYLSLHRGEGFGLGIAESMALGMPAVLTNYSAPTEFCNMENSLLVPYAMVSVRPEEVDNLSYRFVKSWAEPSIPDAAKALRRLYDEPELRKHLGENAKKFIIDYFSVENFKKSVNQFIL